MIAPRKNSSSLSRVVSTIIILSFTCSIQTVSAQENCALTDETLQCLPSFVGADTNGDGQLTSYEYIAFANGIAGGDVFTGFPVPLLLSFSYLSCLCKELGGAEDCCTKGRPYIPLAGADDPSSATPRQICFYNEICSVTGTAVVDATPFVTSTTKAPTAAPKTNEPPATGSPTTKAPTEAPTASPVRSSSLVNTVNSGIFNGQIPISFVYGVGNNAGLGGTDILMEKDGNTVKDDLIGATAKLALEVTDRVFGDDGCEGLNLFNDCGSRKLRNGKSRNLAVTFDVDILPKIDQAITVACPAMANVTRTINATNITTGLVSSSDPSDITSVTMRAINATGNLTLNTTSSASVLNNNIASHTANNTTHNITCANIISTVVLKLVEENSPLSEVSSKFLIGLLDEVKRGRLTELLPEGSAVVYAGGQIAFTPLLEGPSEEENQNVVEVTPNGTSNFQSGSAPEQDTGSSGGGMSSLTIALIVVGSIAGVVAIAIVGFFVMRKKDEDDDSESGSGDESYDEEVESRRVSVDEDGVNNDSGRF